MGLSSKISKERQTNPLKGIRLGDGQMVQVTEFVDCIGNKCPRPQLMTKMALMAAATGDVLEVLIDNPSSMEAIPPMLAALGATHLETVRNDGCWHIYIRKE